MINDDPLNIVEYYSYIKFVLLAHEPQLNLCE